MALGFAITCDKCDFEVLDWDEGNPYYWKNGEKVYVYHPDPDVELATNCDADALCLKCGEQFPTDTEQLGVCRNRACGSVNVALFNDLDGKTCPRCRQGVLRRDQNASAIS